MINEEQVLEVQKNWGEGIVHIGSVFLEEVITERLLSNTLISSTTTLTGLSYSSRP